MLFRDHRYYFIVTWNDASYHAGGIDVTFVQVRSASRSFRGAMMAAPTENFGE
jgi:hypothetical protein